MDVDGRVAHRGIKAKVHMMFFVYHTSPMIKLKYRMVTNQWYITLGPFFLFKEPSFFLRGLQKRRRKRERHSVFMLGLPFLFFFKEEGSKEHH